MKAKAKRTKTMRRFALTAALLLILALLLGGELIGIAAVKNNAAVNGYRAAVRSFEHIDAAQQGCFSAAR